MNKTFEKNLNQFLQREIELKVLKNKRLNPLEFRDLAV